MKDTPQVGDVWSFNGWRTRFRILTKHGQFAIGEAVDVPDCKTDLNLDMADKLYLRSELKVGQVVKIIAPNHNCEGQTFFIESATEEDRNNGKLWVYNLKGLGCYWFVRNDLELMFLTED